MLERKIEGPRPPTDKELPQVLDFLDTHLRSDKSWSINQEYPTAFAAANINNMRVVLDQSDILSHAVIRPLIVKTPIIIYKAAAIGSVVTNPKCRGQGLSRQILLDCLDEAHRQQCDFAILWTDLFDFYRKIGFELAGTEVCLQFAKPVILETHKKLSFLQSNRVATDAVLRLYNQHTVTTIRNKEDVAKYLTIPNSAFYTVWSESGQLEAYAVLGKGADFDGYIHEWGGSLPALFYLINRALEVTKKPLNLICPSHSQNMLKQAVQLGARRHDGYLGMIKITNENVFFEKIHRAARNSGVEHFVLQKNDNHYLIGIGADTMQVANERSLLPIIFGPHPITTFKQLSEHSNIELSRFLPLPLWLWGWDSI
jgi:GNAT superfamily N-acetyltransferase